MLRWLRFWADAATRAECERLREELARAEVKTRLVEYELQLQAQWIARERERLMFETSRIAALHAQVNPTDEVKP